MSEFKQIGDVEILRTRIYQLDNTNRDPAALEAVVNPGKYPLYYDGWTHLWIMTGTLSTGNLFRRGDGMFTVTLGDTVHSGLTVQFPSKPFGDEEWDDFIQSPTCQKGNIEQRIRIHLNTN